jgi:serine protease Do
VLKFYRYFLVAAATSAGALPSYSQTLTPSEIFVKVSGSVWGVTTFDQDNRRLGTGSAVAIADKKVVTNCHVLSKAKSVSVQKQNVSYGAKLLHADPDRDLCILSIDNFISQVAEILPLAKVQPGAKAYAIGNPRGFELTISEGLVSSIRRHEDGGVRAVQTTAPISPGSSGGGLFDDTGKLIGITTSAREDGQNLNFAMPAEWINEVPERAEALLAKRNTRVVAADGKRSSGALRAIDGSDEPMVGDVHTYALTDITATPKRTFLYTVAKSDPSGVQFENGRQESPVGSLKVVGSTPTHHYEELAPVDGWIPEVPVSGREWQLRYVPRNNVLRPTTFKATVGGATTLDTEMGNLEVLPITYFGIGLTNTSLSTNISHSQYTFNARAWWSVKLKRVVRFESERRYDIWLRTYEKERLSLISMQRLVD